MPRSCWPPEGLLAEMECELRAIAAERVSICAAAPRINAVVQQFASLAQSLYAQHFTGAPNVLVCTE